MTAPPADGVAVGGTAVGWAVSTTGAVVAAAAGAEAEAEAEAAVGVDEDGAEVAVTWGAADALATVAGAGVADRCEAGRF